MLFRFDCITYEPGEIVYREYDLVDKLAVVYSGSLIYETKLENLSNFEVIELKKGCIINCKNIFIDSEVVSMDIMCKERAVVYEIHKHDLEYVLSKFTEE